MRDLYIEPKDIEKCPVCDKIIPGFILHEDNVWRCPYCNSHAQEFTIIKIINVFHLDENCPPEIGAVWKGRELVADKSDEFWFDYITGETLKYGDIYPVPIRSALIDISEISPKAVEWYLKNFPNAEGYIYFWKDEVEELSPLTIVMSINDMEADFHDTMAQTKVSDISTDFF